MGQREVIDTLKSNGWMTKKEISDVLSDFCPTGINDSLARLVKGGIVEIKNAPHLKRGYLYKLRDGL